jgi:hypothetical protein
LVWNVGILAVLFAAGVSPSYAMAPKYFAFVWPLLGFVPVMLSRFAGTRWRAALLVGLCAWQGFYGTVVSAVTLKRVHGREHPSIALNRADAVLVDSVARGVLPRIFFMIRDDQMMFADRQKNLIAYPNKWMGRLPSNSVYVSDLDYGNDLAQRGVIMTAIEENHRVAGLESGMYNCAFFLVLDANGE